VLDIASGPGTVDRLAAARVGENGRVLASDISASMLQIAAARKPVPGSAPLSILACSALDLDVADESFQFVLCQQGLQFFPDRPSALREMHRALEPDGVVALATWASERPLGLFGPMTEAMRESGLAEPFPRAFDPTSYTLPASEMQALVETSGFRDVRVETVELDCIWTTGTEALASVSGTVFGPALALLSSDEQDTAMAIFLERLAANRDDEPGARHDHTLATKRDRLGFQQTPLVISLCKRAVGTNHAVPRCVTCIGMTKHIAGQARRARRDIAVGAHKPWRDCPNTSQDHRAAVITGVA
jgi:SAM-dependent methyltransferase